MQQQPSRYPRAPRSEDILGSTAPLEAVRLPFDVNPESWPLDVRIPREIDPANAGPLAQPLSDRPHEGHGDHRDRFVGVTLTRGSELLEGHGDLRCRTRPPALDEEAMTRHDDRELSGRGGAGALPDGFRSTPDELTKNVRGGASNLFRR